MRQAIENLIKINDEKIGEPHRPTHYEFSSGYEQGRDTALEDVNKALQSILDTLPIPQEIEQ